MGSIEFLTGVQRGQAKVAATRAAKEKEAEELKIQKAELSLKQLKNKQLEAREQEDLKRKREELEQTISEATTKQANREADRRAFESGGGNVQPQQTPVNPAFAGSRGSFLKPSLNQPQGAPTQQQGAPNRFLRTTTLGPSGLTQSRREQDPPSVGRDREGVAQGLFGKSFLRLDQPQKAAVNAVVKQNRIDVQAAGVEGRPLSGTTQKDLAGFDSLLDSINVIRSNFNKDFLGPLKGTTSAFEIRRTLGSYVNSPVGQQELVFRQTLESMSDVLLRLRSGAAISDPEFKRLRGFLPKATDEVTPFFAGLDRFAKELRLARKRRLSRAGQTIGEARREATGTGIPPLPPGAVLEKQ